MSQERRLHTRHEHRLDVVLSYEGGERECVTRDVSLGGMLVVIDAPISYGTVVRLRLRLPAVKEELNIEAVVRWQRDDSLGLQFQRLRARDVWALNHLFRDETAANVRADSQHPTAR